jgi:hypothetical protein
MKIRKLAVAAIVGTAVTAPLAAPAQGKEGDVEAPSGSVVTAAL